MSLDDLLEPEVLIAVGVTAALMSPQARAVMRKGIVYGLAGILTLGDKLKTMAQDVSQGAQNLAAEARSTSQDAAARAGHPVAG
jgi:hypothetical protein